MNHVSNMMKIKLKQIIQGFHVKTYLNATFLYSESFFFKKISSLFLH